MDSQEEQIGKKRRKVGRSESVSYLSITRRGIDYLFAHADEAGDDGRLFDLLQGKDLSSSIFGSLSSGVRLSNVRHQTVTGFLRVAGVDYFGDKPLADGKYFVHDSNDATVGADVLDAASSLITGNKVYPMLYDTRDAKKIGTANNIRLDMSHYSFVTATHFLITPGSKFIIYMSKRDGTGLEYTSHTRTVSLLHQVLNYIKDSRGTSMHPVIVLVSNINEFRKCVDKAYGSIKAMQIANKGRIIDFGYPADGYYVIPMNYYGARIVRYIVTHETGLRSDYEKDLLEDTIRELGWTHATPVPGRPLTVVADKRLYCVAYDNNLQRILHFDSLAGHANTECVILIREWQLPYLAHLIKHAKVQVIKEKGTQNIIQLSKYVIHDIIYIR